ARPPRTASPSSPAPPPASRARQSARHAPCGFVDRPARAGFPTERRRRSPVDGRMDNPAGCPRAHPQAVGCPQAPQGPTTTFEERQERNSKALQPAQAPGPKPSSQRRCSTPTNRPHPYNLPCATQQPIEIGHVPEITGHVRRNTQLTQRQACQTIVALLEMAARDG